MVHHVKFMTFTVTQTLKVFVLFKDGYTAMIERNVFCILYFSVTINGMKSRPLTFSPGLILEVCSYSNK